MNSLVPLGGVAELPQAGSSYCYSVYGFRIRTPIPLTIPAASGASPCDIEVLQGDSIFFEESVRDLNLRPDWSQIEGLSERWLHARFAGMFEFLVSPDGTRIFYRPLGEFSTSSFETYLLGMVMRIVLVKNGIEPLHASSVIVDGKAVAFLGSGGFGKSSLAACFVSAGYLLLTDDLLRLEEDGGHIWAYPGPARLKLLPEDARQSLDGSYAGVPMDPGADKFLYPVTGEVQDQMRAPLAAIYSVVAPEKTRKTQPILIDALQPREALLEILGGTHENRLVDSERFTNHFDAAKRIASVVPVRRLSYPRVRALLPDVRAAILADLRGL